MTIDYHVGGDGGVFGGYTYHIEINQADLEDKVSVSIREQVTETITLSGTTVDSATIQSIRDNWGDFLPVEAPFELNTYAGAYSDWKVNLTFSDGSAVYLENFGTLWAMTVNGKYYIQYSPTLIIAFANLNESLNIWAFEGNTTFWQSGDILSLAYP